MNIYLFRKYWSKHKGRLFSLILSIVLLTASAVFSVLNERTELRRGLHESYENYGNYDLVIHDPSEELADEIMQYGIDHVGIISAFAKTDVGQSQYTLGSYENSDAMITAPLRMVKGHLPEKSGEIAMPEFMMQRLFGDADVGDTVSLKITDLDGNSENVDYVLSGIINNKNARWDNEYAGYANSTIEDRSLERPTPSIYVFKDDTAGYKKYYNYFTCMDDRAYFDEAKSKELLEFYDVIGSKAAAENTWKTSGIRKWAYSFSSDMKNGEVLKPEMTDNMKIINLITLLILVTATISMFSGVMSIMPQRI